MSDATLSKHDLAPLVVMTGAIFALSFMDALIKLASTDMQTWQIVILRYAAGLIYAVAFFLLQTPQASIASKWERLSSPQSVRASMLRSVFVLLTAASFFYALGHLPLAQAVTIVFSAPLFMVLFSRWLLKEPISGSALAAIALGFSGVLMIFGDALFQPLAGTFLPMASALFASVFYSLTIVFSRKHSAHTPPTEMVLLQTAFALILALPFGLIAIPETSWVSPGLEGWLIFAVVGMLGTAGHLLIVWALSRETASRLGPIEYTALIWAVLFGLLLFDEWPDWRTLIGACMVVMGCILAGRSKQPRPV